MKTRFAIVCVLGLLSASGFCQNWLENPGFENWYPNQYGEYSYEEQGPGFDTAGPDYWNFFNLSIGDTIDGRVTPAPGLADSGNYADYVSIETEGNGIFQESQQETYAFMSAWVYVTFGSVGIAWVDQSHYDATVVASTSVQNQWVYLSAYLPNVQSSGFALVATSAQGAECYIDNTDAEPTPEPATFAALGLGALGILRRRRRSAANAK